MDIVNVITPSDLDGTTIQLANGKVSAKLDVLSPSNVEPPFIMTRSSFCANEERLVSTSLTELIEQSTAQTWRKGKAIGRLLISPMTASSAYNPETGESFIEATTYFSLNFDPTFFYANEAIIRKLYLEVEPYGNSRISQLDNCGGLYIKSLEELLPDLQFTDTSADPKYNFKLSQLGSAGALWLAGNKRRRRVNFFYDRGDIPFADKVYSEYWIECIFKGF